MEEKKKDYSYQVLSTLDKDRLQVLASDIRADILSSTLRNGGHLSSNLGVVELTIALLRHFDPLKDDILFDVGHQTYAYKILTGRSLDNLRKTGGEPPFSDRFASPFDKYNNGHSSSSISVAYGIAKAKRLKGDNSYTVVVIGDSSMVNGLSMEALNVLSEDRETKLIVILNDNGMSIGKNIGYLSKPFIKLRNSRLYFRTASKLGSAMVKNKMTWRVFLKMRSLKDHLRRFLINPTIFESMSLKYEGPIDGHDFSALDLAMIKAKKNLDSSGSVIVHVLTRKGYGYKPAMEDETGKFHGVSPNFDMVSAFREPVRDFVSLKSIFLLDYMRNNKDAFVITPAMERGSGLEKVFASFPNRSLDVGIAEEHAVTMAGGLAIKGLKPIVDIYSTFLQRGYDEIIEDISRNQVKAVFLIERAGLVGEDGSSHHGIYDVAMVKSIPYSRVFMPYDKRSMARLFKENFFVNVGPCFFRLTKDAPIEEPKYECHTSVADFISSKNKKRLVLAIGPQGYRLLQLLDDQEYSKMVLLNLLPKYEELKSLGVFDYSEIILYDPYSIKDGTAACLGQLLMEHSYKGKYLDIAFKNDFVTFGQQEDLMKITGMDEESAKEKILNWTDALEKDHTN